MINSAGARARDRSVKEVIGTTAIDIYGPELGGKVMERDRQVIRSGETQTFEEEGPTNGIIRTYLSTKGPFRDGSGTIVGLLGISRDITDRKRAEEEMQRNLALLQGIMEGSPDAIFVKDLQGCYVMVNSAGARYLGRTPEEVIGKDDTQLFGPEVGREIGERDRIVLQSGET